MTRKSLKRTGVLAMRDQQPAAPVPVRIDGVQTARTTLTAHFADGTPSEGFAKRS